MDMFCLGGEVLPFLLDFALKAKHSCVSCPLHKSTPSGHARAGRQADLVHRALSRGSGLLPPERAPVSVCANVSVPLADT